jgi:hypothetical protein
MPTTVKYKISYPLGTVAPNVPVVMQAQAESVEAALDVLPYARGLLKRNVNNNTNNISDGTWQMFDLVTHTLELGRWYEVTYQFVTTCATTNVPMGVAIRSSATTDATATGTDVENSATIWTAPLASSGKTDSPTFVFQATAAGPVNLKACVARAVGTGAITVSTRRLYLRDLGKHL